jgi:hypothetical protein
MDLETGTLEGWTAKVPLPQVEAERLTQSLIESVRHLEETDTLGWDSWQPTKPEVLEAFQLEVRAAFLSFFASVLQYHRECMFFLRVLPKPYYHFSLGRLLSRRQTD